jgi:hypothetical protein
MKRETFILSVRLPCLTDKGAVQLVDLLHELVTSIEHHYAEHIHRYHRRQQQLRHDRRLKLASLDDPPF